MRHEAYIPGRTHTLRSRWSPKEFDTLIVTPGDESGFPRFLGASLKNKSLEGTRREQPPLGNFCQSHFFSHVTHTRGSRWSSKEFHILICTPGGEGGFPGFLRESTK